MSLTRTIASRRVRKTRIEKDVKGNDVEIVYFDTIPSQKITMGPMELAFHMADQKRSAVKAKRPKALSLQDKVEALCDPSKGTAYVAQQQEAYEKAKAEYDALLETENTKVAAAKKAFDDKLKTMPEGTKTC